MEGDTTSTVAREALHIIAVDGQALQPIVKGADEGDT
jgi:hypothetical protein